MIYTAFLSAIRSTGIPALKRTSLFGSNDKPLEQVATKETGDNE